MSSRRFVFLIGNVGDEVLIGSTVEIRAKNAIQAIDDTRSWRLVREGATMTLIGERVGFRSSQRFIPCVPLEEVPEYIRRNERIDRVPCTSCTDASCMLCDDDGFVPLQKSEVA